MLLFAEPLPLADPVAPPPLSDPLPEPAPFASNWLFGTFVEVTPLLLPATLLLPLLLLDAEALRPAELLLPLLLLDAEALRPAELLLPPGMLLA